MKLILSSFLGLCVVFAIFFAAPAFAADNVKFYLEAEVGSTFVNLDAGGYNTAGGFTNTGNDWDIMAVPGIHAGGEFFHFVRADLCFNYRGGLGFETYSIDHDLFYETDVDTYSLMFSLYVEPFHYKKWTPYVGAGVGCTWMEVETDDTVVQGRGSDASFSWQAEAGIQYALTRHFTLKLGYRYIDMGRFDIPLEDGAAGNFTGDLTAHEVLFGVRYTF